MKKRRNLKAIGNIPLQNPVAKYAGRFNKALVFADKSKYRRNAKHAKQEAFPIVLMRIIGNVSCFNLSYSAH
jgi:hypothetical protein